MTDNVSRNGVWVAAIGAVSAVLVAIVTGYFAIRKDKESTPPSDPGKTVSSTVAFAEPEEQAVTAYIPMVPGMDFAWIYKSPVANLALNHIGQVSTGQPVEIVCFVHGPPAQGPGGITTVWNKIRYNDGYGYINDAYTDTGTNDPVAPSCN